MGTKLGKNREVNKGNTKFNEKENPHNSLCYTDFVVIY